MNISEDTENSEKNEKVIITMNNIDNSLKLMKDVVDRLESTDDAVEKIKCIEILKDNINILMSQANKVKNSLSETVNNQTLLKQVVTEKFTMKDTKILLVDDNEVNNYVIKQMLYEFNVQVDTALNGEEAIIMFKKKDYDMVLVDYLMPPGIDGIETIRRIRECGEKGKNQLIIGLKTDENEAFREGLNKYNVELILFKPVKYQQISVILQREFPDKINNIKDNFMN